MIKQTIVVLSVVAFQFFTYAAEKEPINESSLTSNQKTLLLMAAGALAGTFYGSQKEEYRLQNSLLYSGLGAALSGVVGLFLFDDSSTVKTLNNENKILSEQVAAFQKLQEPKLISEGKSLLTSSLPKELSKLISPGEWKLYKIDYWVQDPANPYIWFRQNEMFEVIPPEISN